MRGTIWSAFRWAFEGFFYALRTQRNIRIHCLISGGVVLLGLWLGLPPGAWAVLALTIGAVFAAEMVNTSIEAIVDLVSPEPHRLAKIAKDTAAAAVLCLAFAAVAVGLALLGPPLWMRLFAARP